MTPRMLVPFVCLLFWCGFAQADSLQVWHNRNPLPTPFTLNSVAFGDGTYVAAGVLGTIVSSSNAVDWVVRRSGVSENLNAVTFGQGRFVAGGDRGAMLWSTNGSDWIQAPVPSGRHIYGLGYGVGTNYPNGMFVSTVASNFISPFEIRQMYSSNGSDWFLAPPPGNGSFQVRSIASGNNRFLGTDVASANTSPHYSSTGTGWSVVFRSLSGPCAFGNGTFMIAGGFVAGSNGMETVSAVTSTNPASWAATPTIGTAARSACFGNGRFVVVGDNASTGVSSDGTNWSVVRITTSLHPLFGVIFGDGLFVTVGRSGFIATSPDGSNWTIRTKGIIQTLYDVSPADDGFVTVGANGTMATSSNGVEWQSVPAFTSNALLAVVQANGSYVASDNTGNVFSGPIPGSMVDRASGVTVSLNGLGFGGGTFVAVGNNGTILSSTDSIAWTLRNSGTANHLFAVEFGNDRFVAVGDLGTVLTSTDGVAWVTQVSGTGLHLRGLAYGRGRFVARAIFVSLGAFNSVDGVVWEAASDSVPPQYTSTGKIAFGGGWFFGSHFNGGKNLLASRDGRKWSLLSLGTNIVQPSVLAYNNGTFVNVYSFGSISQSDPVVDVEITHNGLAQLNVGGPKNAIYRIESLDAFAATNLWQPLTVLSNAPYVWVDPQSAGATNRVYRAVLLQ